VCSGVLPLCITPDSLSGLHFTVVCAVQWDTPITDDAGECEPRLIVVFVCFGVIFDCIFLQEGGVSLALFSPRLAHIFAAD
jgi:hypothetical protein